LHISNLINTFAVDNLKHLPTLETNKKIKAPHYGEKLKAEIASQGYSKRVIAEKLGISFPTLSERLKDGNFTRVQLQVLLDNRYLCDI